MWGTLILMDAGKEEGQNVINANTLGLNIYRLKQS